MRGREARGAHGSWRTARRTTKRLRRCPRSGRRAQWPCHVWTATADSPTRRLVARLVRFPRAAHRTPPSFAFNTYPPNAQAKLWASPIRASGASTHKIAHQLQRTLGRAAAPNKIMSRNSHALWLWWAETGASAWRSNPTPQSRSSWPVQRQLRSRCAPLASVKPVTGRGETNRRQSRSPHHHSLL